MQISLETEERVALPRHCFACLRIGDDYRLFPFNKDSNPSVSFAEVSDKKKGKIEVFQRVGRCHFDIGDKNVQEVRVVCSDGGGEDFPLKVNVGGAQDLVKKKKEKRNNVRDGAKEYLVNHQLEVTLSDAVASVLKDRPSEPLVSLSNYLLEAHKARSPQPPAVVQAPPQPDGARSLAPIVPTAPKPRSPAEQAKKRPSGGRLAPMNQQNVAAAPQTVSQPSKQPPPLVAHTPRQSAAQIRANVILNSAKENGKLDTALEEVIGKRQEKEPPKQQAKPPVNRDAARAMLMEAHEDGSLDKAIRQMETKRALAASTQEPLSPEAKLKLRAKDALFKAATSGMLMKSLQDATKQCSQRQAPHSETKKNGTVGDIVGENKAQVSNSCDSKEKAKGLFMAAQQNGSLGKTIKESLAKVPADSIRDKLKLQMKNALLEAAASGLLTKSLQDAAKLCSKHSATQEKARSLLINAVQNGSLALAIKSVSGS